MFQWQSKDEWYLYSELRNNLQMKKWISFVLQSRGWLWTTNRRACRSTIWELPWTSRSKSRHTKAVKWILIKNCRTCNPDRTISTLHHLAGVVILPTSMLAHRSNEYWWYYYQTTFQKLKLLQDDPIEPMSHSTSFPVSLCSSGALRSTPRSVVQVRQEVIFVVHFEYAILIFQFQPSSSYTSSLSTASPQHSWSQTSTPRHLIPAPGGIRNEFTK